MENRHHFNFVELKRCSITTSNTMRSNLWQIRVLEHVDLGEYLVSNVFSLEEFEELMEETGMGPWEFSLMMC